MNFLLCLGAVIENITSTYFLHQYYINFLGKSSDTITWSLSNTLADDAVCRVLKPLAPLLLPLRNFIVTWHKGRLSVLQIFIGENKWQLLHMVKVWNKNPAEIPSFCVSELKVGELVISGCLIVATFHVVFAHLVLRLQLNLFLKNLLTAVISSFVFNIACQKNCVGNSCSDITVPQLQFCVKTSWCIYVVHLSSTADVFFKNCSVYLP